MSLTLDQIVEESKHLPPKQLAELVDRLAIELHGGIASGVEESWRSEIRRRMDDIASGRDPGVPGAEVSARIRKIVGR